MVAQAFPVGEGGGFRGTEWRETVEGVEGLLLLVVFGEEVEGLLLLMVGRESHHRRFFFCGN